MDAPLALATVSAGFPSPADDHLDRSLDFNEYLLRHPAATFVVRAGGSSMEGVGIFDGDLLVVDRSLDGQPGDVVVAVVDGALTVKQLQLRGGRPCLEPAHAGHAPIGADDVSEAEIWGVVTHAIRTFRRF